MSVLYAPLLLFPLYVFQLVVFGYLTGFAQNSSERARQLLGLSWIVTGVALFVLIGVVTGDQDWFTATFGPLLLGGGVMAASGWFRK